MSELFLTGNRIIEISKDEALHLAKCIMLLPEWRKVKVGDVVFRLDEIDYEAKRLSKLPKQEKFDIRVKTVDVKKPRRNNKKGIDFSN